jgi:hypothetical protein
MKLFIYLSAPLFLSLTVAAFADDIPNNQKNDEILGVLMAHDKSEIRSANLVFKMPDNKRELAFAKILHQNCVLNLKKMTKLSQDVKEFLATTRANMSQHLMIASNIERGLKARS